MADNPLLKQPGRGLGRPFEKGQSGNPAGRPRGSRNRITSLCEQMLDDEAEAIVAKILELAKGCNIAAVRLVVERLLPPRRERVALDLPQGQSIEDLAEAAEVVLEALANGELAPEEAKIFFDAIRLKQDLCSKIELEPRIARLEAAYAEWKKLQGENRR